MEYTQVYKCLADAQRIRMANLLVEGPLCVCHLVSILGVDQVKVSKQLRYMKQLGVAEGERVAQWMIYRLSASWVPMFTQNLHYLREHAGAALPLHSDLKKRRAALQTVKRAKNIPEECCRALSVCTTNKKTRSRK